MLRPPIDRGNEGRLFSVALSSDSHLVAAGGWTKGNYRGFGNHKVYLFNAANGEIIKCLSRLDNVILHLDFSPDASYQEGEISGYLACALSEQNGIRVWDLSNTTEILRDMTYAKSSYWVEFSPDGQSLVSSSYDGYTRLYTWDKQQQNMLLSKKYRLPSYPHQSSLHFLVINPI